jgi:hypothetical protein
MADVTSFHQIRDRTYRVLDRNRWIEAGRPIDVDHLHAEAFQAVRGEAFDRGRARVEAEPGAVRPALYAKLHGKANTVSATGQSAPDQ